MEQTFLPDRERWEAEMEELEREVQSGENRARISLDPQDQKIYTILLQYHRRLYGIMKTRLDQ